jgi:Fic family protein
LEWTNLKLQDADFHPLICVGTFIYEFLSIHPFQDGNGRLSRLLTTLLLLRYGYGFVQYVSFENIIEKNKKEYYRSLMTAQQFRKTKKEIISDWMIFFFSSLEELTLKLDEKYSRYLKTDRPLNERQNKLLKIITEKKIVYLKDVITLFSNVSEKTLQRDFKRLKSENLIEINGRGNATSYSLP